MYEKDQTPHDYVNEFSNPITKINPDVYNHTVVENIYADYQCPKTGILKKFKTWKKSAGKTLGHVLKNIPRATYSLFNVATKGVKFCMELGLLLGNLLFTPGGLFLVCAVIGQYLIWEHVHGNPWLPSLYHSVLTALHSVESVYNIITTVCYLTGIGLGIKAALCFKEFPEGRHPQPLKKPLTLAICSAILLALPSLLFIDIYTVGYVSAAPLLPM